MDDDKRQYLAEAIDAYRTAMTTDKGDHIVSIIGAGGLEAAARLIAGSFCLVSVLLVQLSRATEKTEKDLLADIAARYAFASGITVTDAGERRPRTALTQVRAS